MFQSHPSTPVPTTTNMRGGSVVVWHDVTEIRRLLLERRRHAEMEARHVLLQRILDELPTSVYLLPPINEAG